MKKTKVITSSSNSITLGIGIVTPLYDFLVNLVGWGTQLQKRLVRISQLKQRENLVDIGSGTGTFCILAKKYKRSARVIGIDPDAHINEIAKEKAVKENLKIEYIESTAQDLPFQSNSLDVAVSSLAFHHMSTQDKKRACTEIYRTLKPAGHFLLADFGPSRSPLLKLFFFFGTLMRFENKQYAKDNLSGRLCKLMQEAGFKVSQPAPMRKGVQILDGTK